MTIFVKIGKLFLVKAIEEAIERSTQTDASSTTSTLSLFHCSRGLELSKNKRTALGELIKAIKKLENGENDSISRHQFQTLITRYKSKLASLAQEKRLSEGETGAALTQTLELIQTTYTQLHSLGLLNIANTGDALYFFRYYAARYFVMKIYADQRLNLIQNLSEQSYLSSFRERAQERAELIVKALSACVADLDRLDKHHPQYQAAVVRQVNINIDALLRDERGLHEKYGKPLDITISLFSHLKLTQQDNGLLTECMEEARRGITQSLSGKVNPDNIDSEWLDDEEQMEWEQEAQALKNREEEERQHEAEVLEKIKQEAQAEQQEQDDEEEEEEQEEQQEEEEEDEEQEEVVVQHSLSHRKHRR